MHVLVKADTVAIVELTALRHTGKRQSHPSLQPRFPVVEMEAELLVLAWLKPNHPLEATPPLRLIYFRHDLEQWERENPAPSSAPPRGLLTAGTTCGR